MGDTRMVGYSYLLVSRADLRHLVAGTVTPKVRARATSLEETLEARLRRNAARRVARPAGGEKGKQP
jgi:hypothetical protein